MSRSAIRPNWTAALSDLVQSVREQKFEGLIAKRLDSRYEPGARSGAWLKMRVNQGQEFVIGGYTPGPHTFRRFDLRLLRRQEAALCGSHAERIHAVFASTDLQTLSRAGNGRLPIRQSPGNAQRALGRRAHRRQDERVPLAKAPPRRAVRVRRMDAGRPSPAFTLCRVPGGQEPTGSSKRAEAWNESTGKMPGWLPAQTRQHMPELTAIPAPLWRSVGFSP